MSTSKLTWADQLIAWNQQTEQYNLPLDGVVAFSTMGVMAYYGFSPLATITTGAFIHGSIHPVISTPKKI